MQKEKARKWGGEFLEKFYYQEIFCGVDASKVDTQ